MSDYLFSFFFLFFSKQNVLPLKQEVAMHSSKLQREIKLGSWGGQRQGSAILTAPQMNGVP